MDRAMDGHRWENRLSICHFHSGNFRGLLDLAMVKERKLGDGGITNLDLGCLR